MSDRIPYGCKYRNISLRTGTYSKLEYLSNTLEPGEQLSKARTVEKLITRAFSNSENKPTNGVINENDPNSTRQLI